MKKVSILIPVYGVEKYIERCAVSLFEQTYKEIEYIFVNDCTRDNSVTILNEIIKRYPSREQYVNIINHESNRGIAATRNTALNHATGDYILWVDSDDFIEFNTVEKCIEKIEVTEADIVVFGVKHIYSDKSSIQHVKEPSNVVDCVCKHLQRESIVGICGAFYLRSIFDDIRTIEGYNNGEDYFIKACAMYYAKKIVAIDLPLYNYDRSNESSMTHIFNESVISSLLLYMSALSSFFKSKKDYYLYRDAINNAKSLIKVSLSISWALSNGAIGTIKKIQSLYPDVSIGKSLNLKHKIILYSLSMKQYRFLKIYINLGKVIQHLFSR